MSVFSSHYYTDAAHRLVRFSLVGVCALSVEIAMIWALVTYTTIHYISATIVSFVITFTISYFFHRRHAFLGTQRNIHTGYWYFMIIAVVGLVTVTGGTYVLTENFAIPLLVARFLVGGLSGLINFMLNAVLNFKVL